MVIKIIKYYIVFLFVFLSWISFASASVVINRVNLNPVEERFIELYNDSNSSKDLTGWSIKRKSSSGLEYSLVSSSRLKDKVITANGYFLLTNEGTYTGPLLPDATWAKSYTFAENNTIVLYNNDEVVDDWIVSKTSNDEITSDDNETNIEKVSEEEDITLISEEENIEVLKITTKIISPKIVTAGIPFSLNSLTTTNREETYGVGRFVWNFGDGELYEVSKAIPFDYIYEYEGEYALTLSYFDSIFSEEPEATNRVTIKVIPADIYISGIGSNTDPFIELQNKSNYEIALSDWIITGGIHYFKIPEGTTILSNKKIKLSPKITGFGGEDIKSVTITNANKEIIATYPTLIKKPVQKSSLVRTTSNNQISVSNLKDDSLTNDSQIINLNDLSADAGGANINISKSTYAWIGLIFIIGLGTASFLMIKRKNNYNDYVDKEIRAEDMTIVE